MDGGRDAKFVGTAELFPSKSAPWVGTVIIQAKHTNGYNRLFSETDFFSANSTKTVIGEEVPRIKRLRGQEQLDHYMLFANRKLAGNADQMITAHIAKESGLPESSVHLCGLEQLEIWLKQFPDVPQTCRSGSGRLATDRFARRNRARRGRRSPVMGLTYPALPISPLESAPPTRTKTSSIA
ncbi:MAG: hypothetical protein WDN69_36470 [Aliidongia sp.]